VRSPEIRIAFLSALLVPLLAACGGSSGPHARTYYGIYVQNLPKQAIFHLNWVEPVHYGSVKYATFRVQELRVNPHGWRALVSFRNDSKLALKLATGGPRSPRDWGLGVFTDELSRRVEVPGNYLIRAAHIEPPLPKRLRPGESWSGTFSSPNPPRNKRVLRMLFGTFFWEGKPPAGFFGQAFAWVTTDFVHAPGPQGTAATTAS